MFSTLRTRFGIPGVISVMALVLAMFGGAYAAQSSNSGKATASAKAKKGPPGPKGPAGAKGDTGAQGLQGTPGTGGKDGTSVVAGAEPSGTANCEGRGGSKFVTGATTTYACNGKEGGSGAGTLAPGATETGVYSFISNGEELQMRLSRRYRAGGERRSYLSAGCPVPKGFSEFSFPLIRASFSFAGGKTLSSTLSKSCRAKG